LISFTVKIIWANKDIKKYEKIPTVKSVERIPFNDKGSIFHGIMK